MKFVILVMFMLVSGIGHAGGEVKNPLIGVWKSDREKTLSELRKTDNPPKEVISCFEIRGACGAHFVEYMEDEYLTVLLNEDDRPYDHSVAPYEVLEAGDGFVVINQFDNGGVIKIFFIESGFYIDSDEFGYRDFYKKVDPKTFE